MKVVHITTVPISSGFIAGLPRFMGEHGHRVTYISSPGEVLTAFGASEGIEVVGIPMERRVSPLKDLISIVRLVRTLRKIRPEIVHTHTPKGGLLGMISAVVARVPVKIYHIHGFPYMGLTGAMRSLMVTTERISCKLADQVYCVSQSIAEIAIRDGIVRARKISVLANGTANGIDARVRFNPARYSADLRSAARNELNISANAVLCVFIGRLANDKGIRELTAAWNIVASRSPDALLLLVGDQDERDPIDSSTLHELAQMPSVRLLGQQSNIPEFYSMADIVVLPTYREGFPTVLLEAAAMEVSVVATEVPGCVDAVVHEVTGILVPVKEPIALAAALMRLIDNPELRLAMGTAARIRVLRDYEPLALWNALLIDYQRLTTQV